MCTRAIDRVCVGGVIDVCALVEHRHCGFRVPRRRTLRSTAGHVQALVWCCGGFEGWLLGATSVPSVGPCLTQCFGGMQGGVGVALGIYDATVAFVNVHMASKKPELRRQQASKPCHVLVRF